MLCHHAALWRSCWTSDEQCLLSWIYKTRIFFFFCKLQVFLEVFYWGETSFCLLCHSAVIGEAAVMFDRLWNICTLFSITSLLRTVSPDYSVWSDSSSETRLVVLVIFYYFRNDLLRTLSIAEIMCSFCLHGYSPDCELSACLDGSLAPRITFGSLSILWGTSQYVVLWGVMESQLDINWKMTENLQGHTQYAK